MIRFLILFLKLRWRLAVGSFRAATAKGGLSTLGAVLGVVAPVILGLLLMAAAAVLGAVGWAAGGALVGGDSQARAMSLIVLRLVMLLSTGLLVLMPAIRASRGASGDAQSGLTRLLLLPLSRRHLHACEVAAAAADPVVLALGPGLLLMGGAMLHAGARTAGSLGLLASALLLLGFGTLAAVLGIGLQLLLRDRRRAERVLLVTMVGWISLSFLPALLDHRRAEPVEAGAEGAVEAGGEGAGEAAAEEPQGEAESEADREERRQRRLRRAETFPLALQVLPSEAHARVLARVSSGRTAAALPSLAWLGLFAAACWRASAALWERLVSSPESSGGGAAVDAGAMKLRRLPFVAAATSAIALTTARTFLRTVRGKLAVALTPMTVAFLGFVLTRGRKALSVTAFLDGARSGLVYMAVFMSLLALLPVAANAFGSDRAGLTLQALAPIPERRLVWGKTLGAFLVYLPCLILSLVAAAVVGGGSNPASLCSGLAAGLAAFTLVAPAGAWVSILLPKRSDLGALTQAGNPHQGAQLILMLVIALSLGLVAGAGFIGGALLASPWGAPAAQGIFAGVALLIAWPLLEAAAGALEKRREIVLTVAQGK